MNICGFDQHYSFAARTRGGWLAGSSPAMVSKGCGFYPIALLRFASILSRKPSVVSDFASGPISAARSLVMKPDSTVSTQTFSSVEANFASAALLSSLARCERPRVQAKIEAMELVEVGWPF